MARRGSGGAAVDDMAGGGADHAVDEHPSDAMSRSSSTTEEHETSDTPSFEEAFTRAKEEHSPKREQAPPAEESTPDDEDEETAPAAAATTTATPAGKATETGLISDEEFTALQTQHADDPAALRKALEGAFTKKTQTLAEQRKSLERLTPYADFIDAYETDPEAAIEAFAQQHGLTVGHAGETTTPDKPAETATTVDAIIDEFKAGLGPELDYLADGLAPAITKLVERLTGGKVDESLKPIREHIAKVADRTANEAADTVMKTFGAAHPDWKEHEPALLALQKKIPPTGFESANEYLEHLYETATRAKRDANFDTEVAKRVDAKLKKIQKSAETTETVDHPVPETKVTKRPTGLPTFEEAAAAAARGERWE